MKKIIFFVCLCAVVAIGTTEYASAQILDDSANRKVMRTRANMLRGDATRRYSNNQLPKTTDMDNRIRGRANCGAVDIGNQHVDSTFSGEINVIVTGDVINTGNVCR